MNIVLINSEYPSSSAIDHGGIATYTYCMANSLAEAGHTMHVIAKAGTVPDWLAQNVRFYTLKPEGSRSLLKYVDLFRNGAIVYECASSRAMRTLIGALHAQQAIDIVEIPDYNGLAHDFVAPFFGFKPRPPFPVVVHLHTPSVLVDSLNKIIPTAKRKSWYRFEGISLKYADALRSPSSALSREVCAQYNLPEERVTIIRHSIDTTPFDRIAPYKAGERFDILFVGRFECRKGAEVILAAIKQILQLDECIHFSIAGETILGLSSNYRDAMERSLTPELRKRVWFLGPVNRRELPALYRRSSLFVMPSLFENAPYSLFEAMAARLPIVSSDAGGLSEIIRHNENGLLFSPERPQTLVDAIADLLHNPQKAQRLADAAYHDVKTRHAPAFIAQETAKFYNHVLQNFAASRKKG
ncbi:MAG: glycosyltransferase family 4 protein [Chitinivibrionales bacterium]|nr:glycosyltransferase family 4 protein [Chitinivibrionales bacterium]